MSIVQKPNATDSHSQFFNKVCEIIDDINTEFSALDIRMTNTENAMNDLKKALDELTKRIDNCKQCNKE